MKGWVYVITNRAMPGLIKVGYTTRSAERRATELNQTGLPHPYDVEYEVLVDSPRTIEHRAHGRLRTRREGKEWFRCTPEEGIAVIKSVIGSRYQLENFKRADREKAEAIRKREEERRKVESMLESKRREIFARYEPSLRGELPNFWVCFVIVFFVIIITSGMIAPQIGFDGLVMLTIIISFCLTPFVHSLLEKKCKEAVGYKSVLERRDAELKSIGNQISSCSHINKRNDSEGFATNSHIVSRYCTKCGSVYESCLNVSDHCPVCGS